MKEMPSYEDQIDLLRLNEKDLEKIEILSRLLVEQDEVVRQDSEERENMTLGDSDFEQVLESTLKEEEENQELISRMKKTSGRPSMIAHLPFFNEEATNARMSAIKDFLNALFPGKSNEIDDLKNRDLLGRFYALTEKYVNRKCEAGSWDKLNMLHDKAFEACDSCFTTSQEGSATASESSKRDSKYDSIYFLYALSNGTYISQRFKRNKILTGGLSGVVHPVAPLALFAGDGVDGLKLKAGEYDLSEISALPVDGFTLYEYFRQGFNASLKDPDQELRIPDTVKILEDGVEISCDMTMEGGIYSDIHEGTAVNRILK